MRLRTPFLILGAAAAGAIVAYKARIEPWWRSWGVDPDEATRVLPGDEIVGTPDVVDTRAVTIDAPPSAVWPWLVQMGYGRGGWYSYDAVDMRGSSATEILPELQQLQVGDLLPTHPDGGFVVRTVEPEHALVVSIDPETIQAQAEAARARAEAAGSEVVGEMVETAPANLKAAGAFLETATSPDFNASWAFVLEPADGGRTRLIERFRVAMDQDGAGVRLGAPMLGFGVFLMVRRQLLGIRDRVERAQGSPEPVVMPSPA
jgi:hypothetical protein